MIELIKEIRWERIAVCFIYLCAQFLVLASLVLTTTSLAPHIVFIILAVVFYFITSIKDVKIVLFSQAFMLELLNPIKRTLSWAFLSKRR